MILHNSSCKIIWFAMLWILLQSAGPWPRLYLCVCVQVLLQGGGGDETDDQRSLFRAAGGGHHGPRLLLHHARRADYTGATNFPDNRQHRLSI